MLWLLSQTVRQLGSDTAPCSRNLDVVTEYSYGESDRRLNREDWGPEYHDAVVESGKNGSLLKQMIIIFHVMNALPTWAQAKLSPGLALVMRIRKVCQ